MKNWFKISILVVLVIGMVIMCGCTSSTSSSSSSSRSTITTQNPQSYVDVNVTCSWGKYGWLYCKGVVTNKDTKDHSVSGYVDVYDNTGIKYDHMLFFVNVDGYGGKTAFECTSTDAEKYHGGHYEYYIDRIY